MKRYLFFILLKTLLISTVITMIGLALLLEGRTDRHYSDLQGLVYGLSLFAILALTLSAVTIYLNLVAAIRNSKVYSVLSFFALPILTAILILLEFGEVKDQLDGYSIMLLPFLITLAFYFTRFQKFVSDREIQQIP